MHGSLIRLEQRTIRPEQGLSPLERFIHAGTSETPTVFFDVANHNTYTEMNNCTCQDTDEKLLRAMRAAAVDALDEITDKQKMSRDCPVWKTTTRDPNDKAALRD
jgi:hypothetical protein